MSAALTELPIDTCVLPAGDWWKSFFNVSEDAHVVCRRDGVIEQVNPKATRQLKLNRDKTEGSLSVFDIILPPADRKLREVLQHDRLHPDTLHSVVIVVAGVENGLADLEITPLSHGYTLITFKDAGRRLRLESHVNRLVTAIDATPDVFILTDAESHITFVNPAFHAVTGYGIESVLGRTDDFLRSPAEQDKVREYQEYVSQGREWIGELTNLRRDGSAYHVEATISPICDIVGQFVGYVACERDITARKQLESDIRLQRDFVRSILHSLDGAIYSLDREYRLTHANDGWRQMPAEHGGIRLQGPPEMGRSLLEYIPDASRRTELDAAFQEVLASGQAQDSRFQAPDGKHWLVRISPWIHVDEVRGLICSITDNTRYHELQSQLFQSQKMEIIGTLAAGVAHDFNNLLQAIRGNISLITLEAPEKSDISHWAEQIGLAASRASEITQQLLSFSRESHDKRSVLDLNQMLNESSQLARRTIRGDVAIDIKPAAKPVPVKVDRTRASQALLNLCVNAQDAMPNGGTLTLSNTVVRISSEVAQWHSVNPGQDYVRCTVADTGSGIPPEVLPRIFDAFFTTKPKDKGTGLGLSIVQRIMLEAGGFVDVESAPGRGTSFHLYFPIAAGEITVAAKASRQPLAHGSGRILVVDDLDLLRDFARSFLEAIGMTVLVAANGREAIHVLERERGSIDLLFTDYNMPGMNGIELIEHVTARWPGIRIILASGYLEDETRKRLGPGVKVFAKPYEMQEAANLITSLLPKRNQAG